MTPPLWKRILEWTVWLIGGVLALPIVFYLIVLAINLRDQPPSEFAKRLEATFQNRPAVADIDNAYVYVMGFVATADADPYAMGLRRVEWLQRRVKDPKAPDPFPDDEYEPPRGPTAEKIHAACGSTYTDCDAALAESDATLLEWLSSEQWRLDRYLQLLDKPGWLEIIPPDVAAPLPAYAPVLDGQRQLLVKAYYLAGQRDSSAVRELLERDVRFWRGVLASSDILISRMIAVAALTRNFNMGNLALRRLPLETQLASMPESWRVPLTQRELSWLRCFAGEWKFSQNVLAELKSKPTVAVWGEEPGWLGKLQDAAFKPMFQPQDTSNQSAEMFVRASDALNVPIEQFTAGLDAAKTAFAGPTERFATLANLYNPVGDVLLAISGGSYDIYPRRVADVEGVRRAAVLATELRGRKVDEQNIEAELAASTIRTPYTGDPFGWDAKEHAILFIGLVPNERGRHALKY
ncbi:MAG TPA: hypothetical protein VIU34_06940 [Steroidobacter sp.]